MGLVACKGIACGGNKILHPSIIPNANNYRPRIKLATLILLDVKRFLRGFQNSIHSSIL